MLNVFTRICEALSVIYYKSKRFGNTTTHRGFFFPKLEAIGYWFKEL